jgi:hypothetical protein
MYKVSYKSWPLKNVTMYDAFIWNWYKYALYDDTLWINNNAFVDETYWPTPKEKYLG